MRKLLLKVHIYLFSFLLTISTVYADEHIPENFGSKGALQNKDITLKQGLTYAIQDEYLSQLRYDLIMETFGYDIKPYQQIQYENKAHIQSLLQLFNENGIRKPKNDVDYVSYMNIPNEVDKVMQEEIRYENKNILMYDKLINQTDLPKNTKEVLKEIQKNSRKHLKQLRAEYNKY